MATHVRVAINDYNQMEAVIDKVRKRNELEYEYGGQCILCQYGDLGSDYGDEDEDEDEEGPMHSPDCPMVPYEKYSGWTRVYDENGYTNVKRPVVL